MKRGQGLPVSTIIVAALGILVLIVLSVIFSNQIRKFVWASGECSGRCYIDENKLSELRSEAIKDRVNINWDTYKTSPCNNQIEAEASGSYIPRGLPSVSDTSKWRCNSCCILVG